MSPALSKPYDVIVKSDEAFSDLAKFANFTVIDG